MTKDLGFYRIREGEIGIIDIREPDYMETLFQPEKRDIERACVEHGFDFNYVMELIIKRPKDVYCIIFDAPKFREACDERLADA